MANTYWNFGYAQHLDPEKEWEVDKFEFPFTDKASYLEWVQTWKSEYAALSDTIRSEKAECKALQKDGDLTASRMQKTLETRKFVARGMLIARKYAKAHSWALKQASAVAA